MDRGQNQDWFTSREVIVEAIFAGLGIYLFLVHAASARQPLIRPALFKDVNSRRASVDVHGRDFMVSARTDDAMASGAQQISGRNRRPHDGAARPRQSRHHHADWKLSARSMRGCWSEPDC